ncbi:manganese transport protein MntH [Vibrio ponticus]|nr:manganese transport protein MntH [Vibrio ponticus]
MSTITPTSNTITYASSEPSSALKGSSKRLIGPAFIAAIGYIDPGNFATNIESGSAYGYQLLWVVLWANLMAMLIQYLSAKLGIVTGKNLAEHLRDTLPKWAVVPTGSKLRSSQWQPILPNLLVLRSGFNYCSESACSKARQSLPYSASRF